MLYGVGAVKLLWLEALSSEHDAGIHPVRLMLNNISPDYDISNITLSAASLDPALNSRRLKDALTSCGSPCSASLQGLQLFLYVNIVFLPPYFITLPAL